MKKKFTISFDELIKNYYGDSGQSCQSNAEKVEELFANYYGKPAVRGGKKKSPPPVLSLSYDDGETLWQYTAGEKYEEYVVQNSVAEEEFEEYVVERSGPSAFSPPNLKAEAMPSGEVSAFQEYQVDVRRPLKETVVQASVAATKASPCGTVAPRSQRGVSPRAAAAAHYLPSVQETAPAKATEDDFIADMQSILTGQKVFDPVTKKTVEKDMLGRSQPPAGQNGGNATPAQEANNSQAIFDRIAQSMQYANAYDLGTLELENRFSDFDRMHDLQQRSVEEKRSKNLHRPAKESSPGAAVDSADFIQDLDTIRKQHFGNAPSGPLASSLSVSQSEKDPYSRPFYDTGEHVLMAGDLYQDQLRVGKPPGVLFSYGQIIAMADLYKSVEQMMGAEVAELQELKSLIKRSTEYYQGNKADKSKDVSNKAWEEATNKRFIKLAEDNYEHFSPNLLFKDAASSKIAFRHGNNRSEWERHHKWAIEEAQKMFIAPENANRSFIPEWPLIINAFGDHYLTDAFAAGHLINKEAMISFFNTNFFSGNSLKPEAKVFFNKLATKAFKGKVKEKFSKLETTDFKFWLHVIPVGHPNITDADRFYEVLIGIAEQAPDQVGNLVVKALHDRLNKSGVEVFNEAGDGEWKLTGDAYLNKENLRIIRKAVQQSVDNIDDPTIYRSNLNFADYFSKVWKYVPQPTEASRKMLERLMSEYTNPESDALVDAAAEIITEQVDLLIERLIDAKGLRPE